jgi:hypothetical protein
MARLSTQHEDKLPDSAFAFPKRIERAAKKFDVELSKPPY